MRGHTTPPGATIPDHVYIPRSDPPSRGDRINAHSDPFWDAIFSSGAGAAIVISGFYESFNPAPSLAVLNDYVSIILGLCMILGASLRYRAITSEYPNIDDYWDDLFWATLAQALGWACYTTAALLIRPEFMIPWWLGLCMVIKALHTLALVVHDLRRVRGERAAKKTKETPPNATA